MAGRVMSDEELREVESRMSLLDNKGYWSIGFDDVSNIIATVRHLQAVLKVYADEGNWHFEWGNQRANFNCPIEVENWDACDWKPWLLAQNALKAVSD